MVAARFVIEREEVKWGSGNGQLSRAMSKYSSKQVPHVVTVQAGHS